MQLIINYTKYLILIILSCSLITTWYGTETEIINVLPAYNSGGSVTDNSGESIWQSMRRQFKLDTRSESAPVRAEIRKMLADGRINEILKAAIPYIYFIKQQTNARGLPAELALIPVIESEYNPFDKSKVGATGLWQLMTVTAHELGIKVRAGYDGRRNVTASTKAALAYFNDLGHLFKGDWYLAIAAYNCGQVRVQSAIHKTGNNSFWGLPLPQETKYYVPRLLAVVEIIKHPEKYGVTLPEVNNKPYFATVNVAKPVNLDKVAKNTGVNIDTLHKLNPDYTRGSQPKTEKESKAILVPVNNVPAVKASLGV